MHTRNNRKALEVFQKLARNFPDKLLYAQQAAIIENGLKKRTNRSDKPESDVGSNGLRSEQDA